MLELDGVGVVLGVWGRGSDVGVEAGVVLGTGVVDAGADDDDVGAGGLAGVVDAGVVGAGGLAGVVGAGVVGAGVVGAGGVTVGDAGAELAGVEEPEFDPFSAADPRGCAQLEHQRASTRFAVPQDGHFTGRSSLVGADGRLLSLPTLLMVSGHGDVQHQPHLPWLS